MTKQVKQLEKNWSFLVPDDANTSCADALADESEDEAGPSDGREAVALAEQVVDGLDPRDDDQQDVVDAVAPHHHEGVL